MLQREVRLIIENDSKKAEFCREWSENASLTKHMEFWQEAGEPDARGKLCKYLEGKSPRKARAGSRTLICNTLGKIKERLLSC